MPDTIYKELKEQGLILSESALVNFPAIRPPKSTFIGKIASLIIPEQKFNDGQFNLVIVPILNSTILVGRANTLLCYKYQIDKETQKPIILEPKVLNLQYKINNIHICDNKFLNDRGQVPFIIESKSQLILFHMDLKQYKIISKNALAYSNISSLRFVSQKEVILLTNSQQVHHISVQGGFLHIKNNSISAELSLTNNQVLANCKIVGNIDEESDSIIILFYVLREKDNSSSEILKVKEYVRTFAGKIQVLKPDFTILTNSHSTVLPEQMNIQCINNFYCIETKTQILILKKKFDKYLIIDNLMQTIAGNTLKLHQNAIVSSHNSESMELSIIHFGDPKCTSKILDSIDLNKGSSEGFRMVWCFKNQKQTCLMLAFQRQKALQFYNVIKMDPMKKMLQVVLKVDKDKISVVQELAVNLGINKKDFYLTLWANSKKELSDIYQFLLPCLDIASIKKEIRLTMRRRKIQVPEFVKILEKISGIIKNELRSSLTQPMLKQYIKNDFLLRKIKLKQKDKKLDHRDFDKVYNSSLIDIFVEIVRNQLFPVQKKLDPLHAMVDEPQKQEMDLRHVFQEFRIMILENYKTFLVSFLSNFKANEIFQVIQKNAFLLPLHAPFVLNMTFYEPEYMTEVELNNFLQKGNGQSQIFSDMTAIQFGRELSKQRIQKQLHEYYPTSKITEAINTMMNSPYGAYQKLRKHGLISCTIYEYQNKLKDIYDIKLFLKVCQFANEYDLYAKESDGKQDLSERLVEVFKKQNNLNGQAYNTVKLYATMHRFMLKNNFCQKRSKGFTTEELIQFTSQDLIALFFLQNKQRKEFIFNQFRNLYVSLYRRPDEFNQVIRKFINSQNCSRIQLQIFIKEVLQKGNDFQIQNQELIQLLIDGFCQKLEIREDNDTKHFLELMNQVELGKHLGMKINKIMQIRSCLHVLNVFNCEKLTYYEMLAMQQKNRIFKELLEKYFNQDLKKEVVKLENEEIELGFTRNMLTILIYIQETIYYDVTSEEVVMTYGETLISWRQFGVIKSLVYEQDILSKLGIDQNAYIDKLINTVLYSLYSDEYIPFQDENQRHIRQILEIYPENTHNIIQTQEYAKLQIGKILKEWGMVDLVLFGIQQICQLWAVGEYRRELIEELLDRYEKNISFASFENFYQNLELSTFYPEHEGEQHQIDYAEYIQFLLIFADRLLGLQKYAEIIEIFSFVKSINGVTIDYLLLSETFLKSASMSYPDEDLLLQGKELIEYFSQNIMNDEALQLLFQTNLQSGRFQNQKERESTILVDSLFTFKKHHVEISLDLLWKIVQMEVRQRFDSPKNNPSQKQINDKSKQKRTAIEQIYYGYYFMIMVFRSPKNSLSKLAKISYNLDLITSLLFRLEAEVDQDSSLFAINTCALIKMYRIGLYKLGFKKRTDVEIRQEEAQYQMIKNFLKEDKSNNKELLDCIARVDAYVQANKGYKKNERQHRYERSKLIAEEKRPKEIEVAPQPEVEVNHATINLKNLLQRKIQISHQSMDILSQKDILEQIYHNIFLQKQQNRQKNRNSQGSNMMLNLNIFSNKKKEQIITEIVEKINTQDYEEITKKGYDKEDVILSAKQIYEDSAKDFHELVHILDVLEIADPQRITIGRACKYYQGVILVGDLKHIFPVEFFTDNKIRNENEWREAAYDSIKKNIQSIVISRDNVYMKSMALFLGSIFESNQYFYKFYLDTLESIGRNYSFTPEAVIRIKILFTNLSEAPELLLENTSKLVASYRESPDLKKIVKQQLEIIFSKNYPNDQSIFQYIAEA